ncbi:hypothetical protein PHMEG_00010915 [Phytophthora megakarya]|uniref:Uncharacterized protein n=1 Tax=Phytophthora megakarya TaxID=4795 RepID=A0A225WEH9_9STRA|nr:hypothetical protein PHMEG_00010915 [Phytophthora megakarya]
MEVRHISQGDILDEVQNIVTDIYMNIMITGSQMNMCTYPGWLQRDGYSCGVLVVHCDELPLRSAFKLDTEQLSCVPYKHFSYYQGKTLRNVEFPEIPDFHIAHIP